MTMRANIVLLFPFLALVAVYPTAVSINISNITNICVKTIQSGIYLIHSNTTTDDVYLLYVVSSDFTGVVLFDRRAPMNPAWRKRATTPVSVT